MGTNLSRVAENSIIHSQVKFVQKPRVEKITPPWFLMEQPSLSEKTFQSRSRKRCISNGCFKMRIEVSFMFFQACDGIMIPPPKVILPEGNQHHVKKSQIGVPKIYTTMSRPVIRKQPPFVCVLA